jgi:cold shock CspA family protein
MLLGTVKKWDNIKKFGFILGDDDAEYFVHVRDLDVSFPGNRLREGQRVKFDVRNDLKGDKAVNVRLA